MKRKFAKLLSLVLAIVILIATVSVCGISGLVMGASNNLLTNGDFENGSSGWGQRGSAFEYYQPITATGNVTPHGGTYMGKATTSYLATYFECEKNADYELKYWSHGDNFRYGITTHTVDPALDAWTSASSIEGGIVKGGRSVTLWDTTGNWRERKVSFNSGNNTKLYLLWASNNTAVYIDDITYVVVQTHNLKNQITSNLYFSLFILHFFTIF